ncbi:MAG: MFS transporter [Chloroflexi bacterium]|nr:MFS transporter [Chloroflexota bacterium]
MSRAPARALVPLAATQTSFRWVMLALAWLVYAGFGMTTMTLAPLVDFITRDLHMNSTQMGVVLGSWQLVYIGTAFVLGTLVDRLGVRRSMVAGIVVIWLSLVLRAVAVDFFTLLAAVALFGVGAPLVSVGAPKITVLWFPPRERGVAAAAYSTAPILGMAFALMATNSVVLPLVGHWRLTFVAYGLLLLGVAMLWWLFARDAGARGEVGEEGAPVSGLRGELGTLLRLRTLRVVLVLGFVAFFLNHGLNNWLPTLLQEQGMSRGQAGVWAALPLVVGVFGLLLVLVVSGPGKRALLLATLLLTAAATTVGLTQMGGVPLLGVLVISGVARNPLLVLLQLSLMDAPAIGARRTGAANGLLFTAAETGGFAGPLLMGAMRDITGDLTAGTLVLAGLTLALAPAAWLLRARD